MKYDEFAFLNQQLAAMLRDGIPLEGELRRARRCTPANCRSFTGECSKSARRAITCPPC